MRTQRDYRRLSRSPVLNHLRTEWTKAKPENRISQFLQKYFWVWIYNTLKSRFGPKYPYPAYTTAEQGIYKLDANHTAASTEHAAAAKEITIGITADWAT